MYKTELRMRRSLVAVGHIEEGAHGELRPKGLEFDFERKKMREDHCQWQWWRETVCGGALGFLFFFFDK